MIIIIKIIGEKESKLRYYTNEVVLYELAILHTFKGTKYRDGKHSRRSDQLYEVAIE